MTDEQAMEFVKNRCYIGRQYFSLAEIMDAFGQSQWTSLCRSRIMDEGLIDLEHIIVDFTRGNELLMDVDGMRSARDILGGYIGEEEADGLIKAADEQQREIDAWDTILKAVRGMTRGQLKFHMAHVTELYPKGIEDTVVLTMREELRSRRPWNRLRVWLWKRLQDILFATKVGGCHV